MALQRSNQTIVTMAPREGERGEDQHAPCLEAAAFPRLLGVCTPQGSPKLTGESLVLKPKGRRKILTF